MPDSLRTFLERWAFNLFPAYRGTGAWITHIAADYRTVRLKLPLNWHTRNYVGTLFGGSIYGAVDPVYSMILMKALDDGTVAVVKSAEVRYLKPGRTTLRASCSVSEAELEEIRAELDREGRAERTYTVELADADGRVCARVEQVVHLRRDGSV